MSFACKSGSPFRDTTVARDVEISNDWRLIDATGKLNVAGDHQFVSVTFDKPFVAPYGIDGIQSGSGDTFNPEIRLVDENQIEYELIYEGKLGNQRTNYKIKVGTVDRVKFSQIKIRSSVPFNASKILWSHYFARDLH